MFFPKRAMPLAFLCVVLMGCASTDLDSSADEFVRSNPQDSQNLSRLTAGDVLELSVEVDGNMEVSLHRAEINANGVATFPLVGDLRVGGLELFLARSVIAKAYSAYYVNVPVIMVNLVNSQAEQEWGYVTITGRISNPGRVQVKSARGIKLTELIQKAGGFSASAKRREIRITRTDSSGKRLRITVDYDAIGSKGNVDADITLFAGDVVYVPERIF